jgi:hypothetical protein
MKVSALIQIADMRLMHIKESNSQTSEQADKPSMDHEVNRSIGSLSERVNERPTDGLAQGVSE